jgi:hypothetical protein
MGHHRGGGARCSGAGPMRVVAPSPDRAHRPTPEAAALACRAGNAPRARRREADRPASSADPESPPESRAMVLTPVWQRIPGWERRARESSRGRGRGRPPAGGRGPCRAAGTRARTPRAGGRTRRSSRGRCPHRCARRGAWRGQRSASRNRANPALVAGCEGAMPYRCHALSRIGREGGRFFWGGSPPVLPPTRCPSCLPATRTPTISSTP